jgi:hypothetical protein
MKYDIEHSGILRDYEAAPGMTGFYGSQVLFLPPPSARNSINTHNGLLEMKDREE